MVHLFSLTNVANKSRQSCSANMGGARAVATSWPVLETPTWPRRSLRTSFSSSSAASSNAARRRRRGSGRSSEASSPDTFASIDRLRPSKKRILQTLPALSPPEVAARNERRRSIRVALEQLANDEEQQRIIYLKYFLDVPNTDIAAELKLSPSNVGVIVHRAVKRLRELMEETTEKNRGQRKSRAVYVSPANSLLLILLPDLLASRWLLACSLRQHHAADHRQSR